MSVAAAAGLMIGGAVLSGVSQYGAGQAAKRVGEVNARGIEEASELNAQLVEEGTETNSQLLEFNAGLAEMKAKDALYRGREEERRFRDEVRGLIGTQRTLYAAGNVDVGSGSALDVQTDTAYQGELDALQIRVNASREAWGFTSESQALKFEAANTRRLGRLQARGIRTSARYDALSSRMGGQAAASAGKYAAVGSILGGAGSGALAIYNSTRA